MGSLESIMVVFKFSSTSSQKHVYLRCEYGLKQNLAFKFYYSLNTSKEFVFFFLTSRYQIPCIRKHFLTNTHLQFHGLSPFGVVSTELNTFVISKTIIFISWPLSTQANHFDYKPRLQLSDHNHHSNVATHGNTRYQIGCYTCIRSHSSFVFTKLIIVFVELTDASLSKSSNSMIGSTPSRMARTSAQVHCLWG